MRQGRASAAYPLRIRSAKPEGLTALNLAVYSELSAHRGGNRLVQALPVCLLVNRRFSQRQALLVLIRDQWTCQLCGERLTRATAQIDHVIPWSRGGSTSVLNAQALCQRCNLSKGSSLHETQAEKVAGRSGPSRH